MKLLYAINTFDFSTHWPDIKYLQWSVPLISLSTISRITVICNDLYPPFIKTAEFGHWVAMWETFKLLKSLTRLRVQVLINPSQVRPLPLKHFTDSEDEILAPVRCLRFNLHEVLRNFALVLPWEGGEGIVGRELEGWGVRITRRIPQN